jgi:hypothetical protein
MDIAGKSVLVLGGWGLVGSAVCRKMMEEHPRNLIVTSLLQSEAEEAVEALQKEYPLVDKNFFIPWWGNIFVRDSLKDLSRQEILSNEKHREIFYNDAMGELSSDVLHQSALYKLLYRFHPEIIVDCINSATAIAYQDIYQVSRQVIKEMNSAKKTGASPSLYEAIERLLCTMYVPQLIRHVQILYRGMHDAGTEIYVKIGTSGTGGMGLNIPYTHSEERPSRVLLSKSAVAGAHTLLLFLMGRTPDGPITKEIKPTAAIAWKKIAYGEIKKRGQPVPLFDCPPEKGIKLVGKMKSHVDDDLLPINDTLKSVFIDTGENGIFSRAEFEAISTAGQMEYVTPEEIAGDVIREIKGGNTGHDIINALDNAVFEPTYRAGFMHSGAIQKMDYLEKEHNISSVAFEMLGPPRLSKILYEAHLLKLAFIDVRSVVQTNAEKISDQLFKLIKNNQRLRSEIISIGIPILLPDGKTLLRGREIKIPPFRGENEFEVTLENIEIWAHDGWVDLRPVNMEAWQSRFKKIMQEVNTILPNDTSSRFVRNKEFWNGFQEIEIGKIAGWIFTEEEEGRRMKA